MQSPARLSRINPKLAGSRREEKNYLTRHKDKHKLNHSTNSQDDASVTQLERLSIAEWGGFSNIKIEEEQDEWQVMRNEYIQTELMWRKQIDETKGKIAELTDSIRAEQKEVRDMERELSHKRSRMAGVREKLKKAEEELAMVVEEDHSHSIYLHKEEFEAIKAIGEKEIDTGVKAKDELEQEKDELERQIEALSVEANLLGQYESQTYNSQLTEILAEQERMKTQMTEADKEIQELAGKAEGLEQEKPIKQEVHRKYLELYERIVVNQELDKVEQLANKKDVEIRRLQSYHDKRKQYNKEKVQIERTEDEIKGQDQEVSRLQEDIREKSTILLNLYQMQSQKIK